MNKRFLQSRHWCIDKIAKRKTTEWDTVIEWLNELNEENKQLRYELFSKFDKVIEKGDME